MKFTFLIRFAGLLFASILVIGIVIQGANAYGEETWWKLYNEIKILKRHISFTKANFGEQGYDNEKKEDELTDKLVNHINELNHLKSEIEKNILG